jgi:hypothetical protein
MPGSAHAFQWRDWSSLYRGSVSNGRMTGVNPSVKVSDLPCQIIGDVDAPHSCGSSPDGMSSVDSCYPFPCWFAPHIESAAVNRLVYCLIYRVKTVAMSWPVILPSLPRTTQASARTSGAHFLSGLSRRPRSLTMTFGTPAFSYNLKIHSSSSGPK